VLIGCLAPDMLTKLPVYGIHLGPIDLDAATEPWAYHRGWPGVGPTHSLLFGVLVGLLVLWTTRNRGWALGLMIGQWAHALTDTGDSVGTMLFFPFTTQHGDCGSPTGPCWRCTGPTSATASPGWWPGPASPASSPTPDPPIDWSWGGPSFVEKAPSSWPGWGDFLLNTVRGAALFALAAYAIWWFVGRRLWDRAPEDPVPAPAPT
jgi:hypothetical protein